MVKMNSAFDELKDIDRQLHANKKKRVESPNYQNTKERANQILTSPTANMPAPALGLPVNKVRPNDYLK